MKPKNSTILNCNGQKKCCKFSHEINRFSPFFSSEQNFNVQIYN